MAGVSAKIVADSISSMKVRLTALEAEYPASLHAEIVSNRELSVSAAQGNIRVTPLRGVRALISATDWAPFIEKYAQSDVTALSTLSSKVKSALAGSTPGLKTVGTWHLPYIDQLTVEDALVRVLDTGPKDGIDISDLSTLDRTTTVLCQKIAVARCHRASMVDGYGVRLDVEAELRAYDHLLAYYRGRPLPASFEHLAQPDILAARSSNFVGWRQYAADMVREAADAPPSYSFIPSGLKENFHGEDHHHRQ